ncbi:esterase-like activity of phytase family protein [Algivirga pacifica]|uniref:Phytase-like domain-containing protein n=1 Tax=Algivirga pacifica TaxID=1162670 RepID=A0ABP9DK81_9BACT
MKNLWLLFCILPSLVSAQEVLFSELPPALHQQYELSAMDSRDDTLYIMSENCATVFKYYPDTETLTILPLTLSDQEYDIEGIALYQQYLFFSNEASNTIHLLDLHTGKELPLDVDSSFGPCQDFKRGKGIEGLEIDEKRGILYALRESNFWFSEASLYCFQIEWKNGQCTLSLLADHEEFLLQLPDGERYTDMALMPNSNELYLFRSKRGTYGMDILPLAQINGLPTQEELSRADFRQHNFSAAINTQGEKGYNTNVEGIAPIGDILYLISDNVFGEGDCGEEGSKPVFGKIFNFQ